MAFNTIFIKATIQKVIFKNNYYYADLISGKDTYKEIFFVNTNFSVYAPKIKDEVLLYRPNYSIDKAYLFCQPFSRSPQVSLESGDYVVGTDTSHTTFKNNKIISVANNVNIQQNISNERQEDTTRLNQVIAVFNAIKDIPELASAKPVIESTIASIQASLSTSATLKEDFDTTF